MSQKNDIHNLLTRGVAEVIIKEELEKKLRSGKKLRVKLGIDPTSLHLHLGRAVTLLKLRDFQKLGHKIVLIIGDFTGVIGDTSDKESERPMLSAETVKKNLATYKEQAGLLLDMKKVEFHYNSTWLKKLGYWEICEQADVFSLAEIIARDNIRRRLTAGTRVNLRETLYPLMQGYDSVMIKSDLEIGGTDQRFNMLAGRLLQKHYGQQPQHVMTMNLLLGTDGRKMSSSWGNTINLTDEPDDMYGKVMSIPDTLTSSYIEHCTRVPMSEIQSTENPRDAKMCLAHEVVSMYHGEKKARAAQERFVSVFQKKEAPDDMPEIILKQAAWSIVDLLVAAKLATSKSDARRLIAQKGVTLDGENVSDPAHTVNLTKKGALLKKGKRHFVRVVLR